MVSAPRATLWLSLRPCDPVPSSADDRQAAGQGAAAHLLVPDAPRAEPVRARVPQMAPAGLRHQSVVGGQPATRDLRSVRPEYRVPAESHQVRLSGGSGQVGWARSGQMRGARHGKVGYNQRLLEIDKHYSLELCFSIENNLNING